MLNPKYNAKETFYWAKLNAIKSDSHLLLWFLNHHSQCYYHFLFLNSFLRYLGYLVPQNIYYVWSFNHSSSIWKYEPNLGGTCQTTKRSMLRTCTFDKSREYMTFRLLDDQSSPWMHISDNDSPSPWQSAFKWAIEECHESPK